jgi:hypothetical protein
MDEWQLFRADELLNWMLPRQRRMLRTLIRAQELNALQLRRSARRRLRGRGHVSDKADAQAARDLASIQQLIRQVAKATGAEFGQIEAGKALEEAAAARRRAARRAE